MHFFAFVTDLQRCLFIELWQFGPRTRDRDFYFAIVRVRPSIAMPLPPSVPPDLRILDRAMWLQITAGIAVNSHPHVKERTAKMRLQIAAGGVRGTVCGTASCGDGGVSSAVAQL